MTSPTPAAPNVGDIKATQTTFETAFHDIEKYIKEAVQKFNDLVHKIAQQARNWGWVSPATVLWVEHNLHKAADLINKLVPRVGKILEHAFPVVSLLIVSCEWVIDVMKDVSDIAFETGDKDRRLSAWTGGTATAYTGVQLQQKLSAEEFVAKVTFVSDWLLKIGKANVEFVTKLLDFIPKIVNKIVAALVDASTVIDIPWAIDRLAGALGDLVEKALSVIIDTPNRLIGALDAGKQLVANKENHTRFPKGNWPEGVRA